MTTIYHYFLSFLRQNRNKTCLELGEKAPKNEKNVAKRHLYKEKVAKSPQYSQKTFVLLSRGGDGLYSCGRPCNRMALIVTISCIKGKY